MHIFNYVHLSGYKTRKK